MDEQRKRELREVYRNSRPPMGVLAFRCVPTGESFLLASRNISADTNSVTFKLNSGYHPNRHLLELWERYGEEGFAVEVLETLDVEGILALRSISERCAERIGDAERILEAQNEVLYAEERTKAKPCE